MMDRVIRQAEADPAWRSALDSGGTPPTSSIPDAICHALRETAKLLPVRALVAYTRSGATAVRGARDRPAVPVLGITPELATARRLALVWGVHPVHRDEPAAEVPQMVVQACATARGEGFARPGEVVVIASGVPFGVPGTTNLFHIVKV
jgi:pyruvate kinase